MRSALRRHIVPVLVVTAIFATVGMLSSFAFEVPILQAALSSVILGLSVGLFEELYVQSHLGRPLRAMHPLLSAAVYTAVVLVLLLAASLVSHLLLRRTEDWPQVLDRLPIALPLAVMAALAGILAARVIGFLGAGTLFNLITGKYYRPLLEQKIFLFLDIKDSTATAQRIGPVKVMDLIRKFLFDVSKPLSVNGGQIYLYTGDGLIAIWNWDGVEVPRQVLRAIDQMFATVDRESDSYRCQFATVPEFRVGVHGGPVVIAEQGDTKRAIGVYGDAINIAARMEQIAKERECPCVISAEVVGELARDDDRLRQLPPTVVKGIAGPIQIFEYAPRRRHAGTNAGGAASTRDYRTASSRD